MKPGPDPTFYYRFSKPLRMSDKDLESQGALIRKLKEPSAPDPYPAFTKKANECAENMKYGIELCKYKVRESGLYECLAGNKVKLDECLKKTGDNVSDYVNDKWEKTTGMAKYVMKRGDEAVLNRLPYTLKHDIMSGREKEEERQKQERDLEEMRQEYPEFRLFVKHAGTGRTATLLVPGNMSFDHLNDRLLKDSGFPPFNMVEIPNRGQHVLSDIAGDTLASEGIKNDTQIIVYQRLGRGGGTRKRRGKRQKATRKRTTPKRRRKGTRKKRYSK